jgi:integrase
MLGRGVAVMARQLNKLNARKVTTLAKPGRHSDGGGLYIVIDPSGARRWVFLFRWRGKLKEMGLGGIASVSLADAREAAGRARKSVAAGINPIEAKRRQGTEVTFGEAADQLVASLAPGWRNPKHKAQWEMTLREYCKPIRSLPIDSITTEDVLSVLNPIWIAKPETAGRVRGRVERVLDAAKARGQRSGENPAAWRGHLRNLLPKRQVLSRGHHAAMPFERIQAFLEDLRQREAVAAKALEFLILSAARTGEVTGARWSEFSETEAIWTVPAGRMKGGREHRVPLSTRAVTILEELALVRTDPGPSAFIFPGSQRGKPISNGAMNSLLRRMGETEITVHGFRSSFRDWAGERSTFPREIAEAALAHLVGDETERAYRRVMRESG